MRRRLTFIGGSVAALGVGAALLCSSPAHATTKSSAITIRTSCTVIPLGNGLEITLCL